ncbi:TPA: tetratricopeptide repeat protein [Legionella anisa]
MIILDIKYSEMFDNLPIEVSAHIYSFFNKQNEKHVFSRISRKYNKIYWIEECKKKYGFSPEEDAREIYLAMALIDEAIDEKNSIDEKDIDLFYEKLIRCNTKYPENSEIIYHLAKLYLRNKSKYQNIELGKSLCEQAVALNHNGARQLLGSFYRDGLYGYPFDSIVAVKYYKDAAISGSNNAAVELGISLRDGCGSIKRNGEEAIYHLNMAINRNDNRAARILGLSYCDGIGAIPQNQEKAILNYKLAATRGDNIAARDLGSSFRDGLGCIRKNAELAVEYFRMAALRGDIEAAINLGVSFAFGRGCIAKDHNESAYYLTLAANSGDQRAVKMLEDLNMNPKLTLN